MPDSVFQAVDDKTLLDQAQIMAMRQVAEGLSQTNRLLERQGEKLDQVHTKVVSMEAQDYKAKIEAIEVLVTTNRREIDLLRSERDKRAGAVGLVDWLAKTAPWLLAILAAMLAPLLSKHLGGP